MADATKTIGWGLCEEMMFPVNLETQFTDVSKRHLLCTSYFNRIKELTTIVVRMTQIGIMMGSGWMNLPTPIRYRIMRWVAMPYTSELLAVMAAERRCMAWHQERCRQRRSDPPQTRWKLSVTEFSPQRILYRIRQEREIVFMLDWV